MRRVASGLRSSWWIALLASCQAFDRTQYASLRDAAVNGNCLTLFATSDAGCRRAIVPEPPAELADHPSNQQTYTLALRSIEIGPRIFGNWQRIGFDLDGECTSIENPTATSCIPNNPSSPVIDGEDGRDNAFGAIIGASLHVMDSFRDSTLTESLATGRLSVGLRIDGWNGGNDRSIRVEWLAITNGRGTTEDGRLLWDGRDRWSIHGPLSLEPDLQRGRFQSVDAWIACGYFRAAFSDRPPLALMSRDRLRLMRFHRMQLVGPFSPQHGGFVDLVGLWTMRETTEVLPWFDVCPPPIGDSGEYRDRLRSLVNSFDVRDDLSTQPSATCNAATIVMRLEFRPAHIEGVDPMPVSTIDPCSGDAGLSDAAR